MNNLIIFKNRINMKTLKTLLIAIAILASYTLTAQVAVTTDGSSAAGSAMLDVKSTDKGLLPPRMTEAQRDVISSAAAGLMVWCTNCGDNGEMQVYNGTEWTNMIGGDAALVYTPVIGEFYQGGVVFYLDGSGGGLICAVSDQTSAEWGCSGTEITGADGSAIGTGAQNTIDIIAGCSTVGIAADICANLSLNGYDDWFLPSKDELNEMYKNKSTINTTAGANGGSSFTSAYYWSSTEGGSYSAWTQNFSNGNQSIINKSNTAYVRAVRAF